MSTHLLISISVVSSVAKAADDIFPLNPLHKDPASISDRLSHKTHRWRTTSFVTSLIQPTKFEPARRDVTARIKPMP